MKRNLRLISTILSTAVAVAFLVVGIFAQASATRNVQIDGKVYFKAENVSAEVFVYHALSATAGGAPYYNDFDTRISRATINGATPDATFIFNEKFQNEKSIQINSGSVQLKMSDAKPAYTYYIQIKNIIRDGNSAGILLSYAADDNAGPNFTVSIREEFDQTAILYNEVGEKLYIAPNSELVLAVSIEMNNPQMFTEQTALAMISSHIELTRAESDIVTELTERSTSGLTISSNTVTDYSGTATDIFIPRGVTAIGASAFSGKNLTSVFMPNTITTIGNSAFAKDIATIHPKNIKIPNSVLTIGASAFGRREMQGVSLSSSLTSMGEEAFTYNNISSFFLPKSVTTLGGGFIRNNQTTLREVIVEDGSTSFKTVGNVLYSKDGGVDYGKTLIVYFGSMKTDIVVPNGVETIKNGAYARFEVTSISLPDGLKTIEIYAFYQSRAKTVTIPASVTSIAAAVFYSENIGSIETAYFMGNGLLSNYGINIFDNAHTDFKMIVPLDSLNAFREAQKTKPFSNRISNTDDTDIEQRIVGVSQNLSYTYNSTYNGYTVTGFSGTGSTEAIILETYNRIYNGYEATSFSDTTSTEIVIPETHNGANGELPVVAVGNSAFSSKEITSVIFPNSIIEIEASAFQNNNLTKVTLSSSLTNIKESAFRDNKLTSVVLPDSVYSIGTSAFNNNVITDVSFGKNLSTIGAEAFAWHKLTQILIPASVSQIGDKAFSTHTNNNNLNKVIFESSSVLGGIGASIFSLFDSSGNILGSGQAKAITMIVPQNATSAFQNTFGTGNNATSNKPISINTEYAVLTYEYNSTYDGYYVTGFESGKETTNVIIPTHYTGANGYKPIVGIADNAFNQSTKLHAKITNLYLPRTIKYIGANAFYTNSITGINLPEGLETIGTSAFHANKIAQHLIIPSTVTSIGTTAFRENSITGVEILPSDITTVTIKSLAFYNNRLVNVYLPKNLTTIESGAFAVNATTLKNISIQAGNANYKVENGMLLTMNGKIVYQYFGEESHVIVPHGVETLQGYSFRGTNIVSISLPNTLKSISSGVFSSTKLVTLHFPASMTSIGGDSTLVISTLESIVFEGAIIANLGSAFGYTIVNIETNLSKVKFYTYAQHQNAFKGVKVGSTSATYLSEKTLEEYVPLANWGVISEDLKYTYDATRDGYIVNGFDVARDGNIWQNTSTFSIMPSFYNDGTNGIKPVIEIGASAFREQYLKTKLTRFVLPSHLQVIKSYAFYGSRMGSTNIALPGTMTTVEIIGLYGIGLSSSNMYLPKSLVNLGLGALSSNSVKNIIIESGNHAFEMRNGMMIRIAENSIHFSDTTIAKILVIPSGITRIEGYALIGRGLTKITIPASVTEISGNYAFASNPTTEIIFEPNSRLAVIGHRTFSGNGLTSINLPATVTSISTEVFHSCSNLTIITLNSITPPTLANVNAIPANVTSIKVPSASVNAYKSATNWSNFASIISAI